LFSSDRWWTLMSPNEQRPSARGTTMHKNARLTPKGGEVPVGCATEAVRGLLALAVDGSSRLRKSGGVRRCDLAVATMRA
jgi:hypothetical protein